MLTFFLKLVITLQMKSGHDVQNKILGINQLGWLVNSKKIHPN